MPLPRSRFRLLWPILIAAALTCQVAPALGQPIPDSELESELESESESELEPEPESEPEPEPEPVPEAASKYDHLTSAIARPPEVPLDIAFHILSLPEYAVEFAVQPAAMFLRVVERYRIDHRISDFFQNDAGTISVAPKINLKISSGLGAGATLSLKKRSGSQQRLDIGALARFNLDSVFTIRHRHRIASLEGRLLDLRVEYERNQDSSYYGLGDSVGRERHVLSDKSLDSYVALDLVGRGVLSFRGVAEVGLRQTELGPGIHDTRPSVEATPMNGIVPPPGFEQKLVYPRIVLRAHRGTRDLIGRPSVGWLWEGEVQYTQDVNGERRRALSGRLGATLILPILPYRRVFVLHAGIARSSPLGESYQVPLHALVTPGRDKYMRGFARERFRDRATWWGSAEYRFPVWQYRGSGLGMTPTLFYGLSRVAGSIGELSKQRPRQSYGVGLRLAHDDAFIANIHLTNSVEGPRVTFTAGKEF